MEDKVELKEGGPGNAVQPPVVCHICPFSSSCIVYLIQRSQGEEEMIAATIAAAYRFLPCMSAAVGLVLLVFPTPLNSFCWFPGGL